MKKKFIINHYLYYVSGLGTAKAQSNQFYNDVYLTIDNMLEGKQNSVLKMLFSVLKKHIIRES